MIPQVYEFPYSTFEGKTAPLRDTVSCIVTEERNGAYDLKIVVGQDDPNFEEIQNNKYILAKANDTDENLQAFRIYAIEKNINGRATIYAEHVSRRMRFIPLNPTNYHGDQRGILQTAIPNAVSITNPFTLNAEWTNWSYVDFKVTTPTSLFAMLTGTRGSLTDLYKGGEWHFDNFTATFYETRGSDNGVEISYGKNLTDLNQENRIENTSTGIYPYWTGKDENDAEIVVTIPDNPIVYATGHEDQDFERILPVDMSDKFKEAPTAEQLQSAAESYIMDNNIMVPKISLKVSFAPLWEAMGYEMLEAKERVSLCDIVTIRFEKLGVVAKAKVTKTEYDVLTERYTKITLGEAKQSFSEKMAQTNNDLNKRISNLR